MSNDDVEADSEDFAALVRQLEETPNTLSSIIEEIRALSEPPASAGGPTVGVLLPHRSPANAGGPAVGVLLPHRSPANAGGPTVGVLLPHRSPANAGGSDISALRWRNSDGEFSALENICHLRDIETEGYAVRINKILAETNPFLADIDGGRLAAERNYNDQDPDLALRAFTLAREKNLEKLKGVATEVLEREGTLEGVGRLTLKRLAEMMEEHDEAHIEELRVLQQRLKRRQ